MSLATHRLRIVDRRLTELFAYSSSIAQIVRVPALAKIPAGQCVSAPRLTGQNRWGTAGRPI
jgi:hypothetical protein